MAVSTYKLKTLIEILPVSEFVIEAHTCDHHVREALSRGGEWIKRTEISSIMFNSF